MKVLLTSALTLLVALGCAAERVRGATSHPDTRERLAPEGLRALVETEPRCTRARERSVRPERVERLLELGVSRGVKGDLDGALAAVDAVVSLRPDDWLGHAWRAWLLSQANDTGGAGVSWARAREAYECATGELPYIQLVPGHLLRLSEGGLMDWMTSNTLVALGKGGGGALLTAYSTSTGRFLFGLRVRPAWFPVALAASRLRFATVERDETLNVYSMLTGSLLAKLPGRGLAGRRCNNLSPSLRLVVCSGDDAATLVDLTNGGDELVLGTASESINAAVFGPGEEQVAVATKQDVSIWSTGDGHRVRTIRHPKTSAMAWSERGETLALALPMTRTVQLVDAGTGEDKATIRSGRHPMGLRFQGDVLAIADHDKISPADASRLYPDGLELTPSELASLAKQRGGFKIALWSMTSRRFQWNEPTCAPEGGLLAWTVEALAGSPDGHTFALGCSDGVGLLDAASGGVRALKLGEVETSHSYGLVPREVPPPDLAFAGDDALFIRHGSRTRAWDLGTGQLLDSGAVEARVGARALLESEKPLQELIPSKNGSRRLLREPDGAVAVRSVVDNRVICGSRRKSVLAEMSADGETLLTMDVWGAVEVRDVDSCQITRTQEFKSMGESSPLAIQATPEGEVVVAWFGPHGMFLSIDESRSIDLAPHGSLIIPYDSLGTTRVAVSSPPKWIAVSQAASSGSFSVVFVYSVNGGEWLAMVAAVPDESTDAAFVLTADGKADVFGADAATLGRSLQCAFGEHRFDWEACGQDLTVKGVLARALAD